MQELRIERWAHALVHYSLNVKAGQKIAIQATTLATPLLEAVYTEVLRAGAYPIPVITIEGLDEIMLRRGNDEQLALPSLVQQALAEQVDARLMIASSSNTRALSGIAPERITKRNQSFSNLRSIWQRREQAGQFRWCVTLYPTNAYAQDADMSLHEFEEFVFDACFLNDPDPIARWQELSSQQQRLVDVLKGRKTVHIVGERTDLTLSIQDRIFINSDGKRNFPSGEVFTSPVEDSADGHIQFDIPSSYDGRAIEGVHLVFRKGKVIEASARQGEEYLLKALEQDAGASYLGEFAFGNNPRVNRGTRNILFDEKMCGTVHLALGNSYTETGGLNKSALHWDMVCDLRTKGEVWVDDMLFLKDGQIVV
ncbi:MAG: aminopeptidase [Chloroflexi bacterium]|nr:MAG: aminopeptidase [Chloroflexota bacterium]